jgi:cytochrome c556
MKRALFGLVLLVGSVSVSAEGTPQDIQKYRHEVFEGMAKHMKSLSLLVNGTVVRPKEEAVAHARAVHESGKMIATMFPAGTEPGTVKTDALPAVWAEPDAFRAAAEAFVAESGKLVELTQGEDKAAAAAQLRKVGQSCGACHDKFRVDEE